MTEATDKHGDPPRHHPHAAAAMMRRIPWGWVFLVAMLLGAVAVWVWSRIRWPEGPVEAVVPVDRNRVVAVVRAEDGPHMLLVERWHGPRWTQPLPGFTGDAARHGISAVRDLVVVRIQEPGGSIKTRAFDADTGKRLWDAVDSGLLQEGELARTIAQVTDGTDFFEVHDAAYDTQAPLVFAVDTVSGSTRWSAALPGPVDRIWLRKQQLIVAEQLGGLLVLDRESGKGRGIDARFRPCVLPDGILAQNLDGLLRYHVLPTLQHADLIVVPWALTGLCGVRGNEIVASIVHPNEQSELIGVDKKTLAPRWTLDLGRWAFFGTGSGTLAQSAPDLLPFSGELARYVPALMVDTDPNTQSAGLPRIALVMFDLAERRVLWRSAAKPELADYTLFSVGGLHYLAKDASIAILDGSSGGLTAAVRIAGAAEIKPFHLRQGKLWVYGEHTVTALHAGTFEVRPGPWGDPKQLPIVDAYADFATLLAPTTSPPATEPR